jgi:hypothetical protein
VTEATRPFVKPNIPDDRAAFEAERRRNSLATGADDALFERARDCPTGASVRLALDSGHAKAHVLAALRALSGLATKGQFPIVADTILGRLRTDQTAKARSRLAAWRRAARSGPGVSARKRPIRTSRGGQRQDDPVEFSGWISATRRTVTARRDQKAAAAGISRR